MKQYTNEIQTAKLIELGFEKPKAISSISWEEPDDGIMINRNSIKFDHHYSICELLEMLPMFLDEEYGYTLSIYNDITKWIVAYDNGDECSTIYAITKEDLIDALYDMIVKLKEEGVIC